MTLRPLFFFGLCINVALSFCCTVSFMVTACLRLHTCSCRRVVHSGESLRARRSERRQLAHCAHSLLQQGGFTQTLLPHFHSHSCPPPGLCLCGEVSYIPLVIACTALLMRRRVSFSVSRAPRTELTGVCARGAVWALRPSPLRLCTFAVHLF